MIALTYYTNYNKNLGYQVKDQDYVVIQEDRLPLVTHEGHELESN